MLCLLLRRWHSPWTLNESQAGEGKCRAAPKPWGRTEPGPGARPWLAPEVWRLVASPPHTYRMGRYPAILMSLLGLLIFGFGTAFVNTFYQFLLFRFAVALAAVGYAISSVSLGD